MRDNYFKEIVLPSVSMPYKPSYTLRELCKILDCHKTTVWRMVIRGEIRVAPNKRIYCKDIECYFNQRSKNEPQPEI